MPGNQFSPEPWKTGPGLNSTLQGNFNQEMYQPNLIPLFIPQSAPSSWFSLTSNATPSTPYQAANGTGQNATCTVVGFVGVMVSQADLNGSNMNISLQPTSVVDPTASMPNPQPVGTSFSQFGSGTTGGPIITTFTSAKLTQ
jgi:hypothetical protein